MAHTLRGDVADGLVFHADRGTQFTSEQLWEVCRNLGIAQSVGVPECVSILRWLSRFGRRLKPSSTTASAGQRVMLRVRLRLTGLKSSTTVGAGTEALGMVSPVDVENHIGLTTSRKEIAA